MTERAKMLSGWIWFDDSPRSSFQDKVEKAMRHYLERFGRTPDVCYVHPQTMGNCGTGTVALEVIQSSTVQPNHFWLGVKVGQASLGRRRRSAGIA